MIDEKGMTAKSFNKDDRMTKTKEERKRLRPACLICGSEMWQKEGVWICDCAIEKELKEGNYG